MASQVGVTPEYTELPRNHCPRIESYPEEDRPLTICPPEADPKWRFFWRIVRINHTHNPTLSRNAETCPESNW